MIVMDEFDAIAAKRSGGEEAAARDSVVNQLLVLIDGVANLPVPTFVIALTNRRELVDDAVLRPGRLEVQPITSSHLLCTRPSQPRVAAALVTPPHHPTARYTLSSVAGARRGEQAE